MILLIFIFQVKFKKNTANEETVLGGAWGHDKVLGEWRKCWGSGGGAGKVEEVLGAGERCKGSEGISRKVLGEWSRCLMAGQGAMVVVEVEGE